MHVPCCFVRLLICAPLYLLLSLTLTTNITFRFLFVTIPVQPPQELAQELAQMQQELKIEYAAPGKTFGELTDRYYKIINNKVEMVDMSQPRPCSYQKTDE